MYNVMNMNRPPRSHSRRVGESHTCKLVTFLARFEFEFHWLQLHKVNFFEGWAIIHKLYISRELVEVDRLLVQ